MLDELLKNDLIVNLSYIANEAIKSSLYGLYDQFQNLLLLISLFFLQSFQEGSLHFNLIHRGENSPNFQHLYNVKIVEMF